MAGRARCALWLGDVASTRADLTTLDDSADALTSYRDALQEWRDLGLVWDEALCGLDMAILLDPADPEVRAAGDAAREILARLEAAPILARLDAAMARSRESGRPVDALA